MIKPACALAGALLLTACVRDSVTLLPNEDGASTGAVAVIDEKKGREVVVDQPLTATKLTTSARPRQVRELKDSYSRLLAGLPPGAVGFTLTFPMGSSRLTDDVRPVLDQVRAAITQRPGAEVQVTGYTDTVGSADLNDRLSQKRAEEVMQQLIELGFPADMLTAVGRGERDLAVDTPDEMSNDQNRRVEVIVR
ncbi:MAG: OmpA family protein [Novosphingobium sp.]